MNKKLMNGQSLSDVKSTTSKCEKALMETGQEDFYIFMRHDIVGNLINASLCHACIRKIQHININMQLMPYYEAPNLSIKTQGKYLMQQIARPDIETNTS